MTMLNILHHLPAGLLTADVTQLHELLGGPTLIHLEGRRTPALFVSVLLHGNETSGFLALQKLLQQYQDKSLPRAMSIFIGNTEAARFGQRRLDNQPDYNRIWPGGIVEDTPEHQMVQQVFDIMHEQTIFASIDLHNNTGLNPHYACINRLDRQYLHLATLFNRTVVYFTKPTGVQSLAFAELGPAVTLECGQVGQQLAVNHALDYLHACLHLSEIPDHAVAEHDIDLFHTVAVVKIPTHIRFGFTDENVDVRFSPDMDHFNFRELPIGTYLATVSDGISQPFDTRDEHGREVSDRFFQVQDGQLLTTIPVMPSMLTLNTEVIRQDCLCYLMERISTSYPEKPANYVTPAS